MLHVLESIYSAYNKRYFKDSWTLKINSDAAKSNYFLRRYDKQRPRFFFVACGVSLDLYIPLTNDKVQQSSARKKNSYSGQTNLFFKRTVKKP
jgi:hypothetical protein